MDEAGVLEYVTQRFAGLDVVSASGDTFFFYDPDRSMDPRRRLPFATIVTRDAYDSVSKIDRAGVFRLNVGVSRETYRSMFGELPRFGASQRAGRS